MAPPARGVCHWGLPSGARKKRAPGTAKGSETVLTVCAQATRPSVNEVELIRGTSVWSSLLSGTNNSSPCRNAFLVGTSLFAIGMSPSGPGTGQISFSTHVFPFALQPATIAVDSAHGISTGTWCIPFTCISGGSSQTLPMRGCSGGKTLGLTLFADAEIREELEQPGQVALLERHVYLGIFERAVQPFGHG